MFILWLFTGLLGGHRFYVGKTVSGFIYLFTLGVFFIGWILDFFKLGSMVNEYNMMYGTAGGRNVNQNSNTNANNIVINMAAPIQQPVQTSQPAQPAQPQSQQSQLENKQ